MIFKLIQNLFLSKSQFPADSAQISKTDNQASYDLINLPQGLKIGSIHIRHVDCGSCNGCDWELTAALNPYYDIQRLGVDFVASPRHADMLMVTGPVTKHLETALQITYSATPEPKAVVAFGDCACGRGIFNQSYAVCGGAEKVVPVHLKIYGCPPQPDQLLTAIRYLQETSKAK